MRSSRDCGRDDDVLAWDGDGDPTLDSGVRPADTGHSLDALGWTLWILATVVPIVVYAFAFWRG